MWPARRLLKYSLAVGGTIGTFASLRANQYNVDSIGVVRLGRAGITVLGIAYLYKTQLYAKKLDPNSSEYLKLRSSVHKQAAEKLLELCCLNKGVYIKVGQHIGALEYILPAEYVDTMKVLHSHAPTSKIEELYQVIREDLKKEPLELFANIETEPLGTASLAQVHKATMKDGTIVAIKIQHPYVRGNSTVDVQTMDILFKFMSWIFPEFKFNWLVEETKINIPIELNFMQEGKNAEKVAEIFKNTKWLKIPCICWDLCSERVLTMEYLEGGQINDIEYIHKHKINPVEVSEKLGLLYSDMIFVHGFVHSDPHPGNILIRKSASGGVEIVLLDHGLYANLSNSFRWEYSKLWLSILNKDKEGMKMHGENLGVGEFYGLFACMVTGRMWDSIVSGVQKTKFSPNEKEEFQKVLPTVLPQISEVLAKVNRQMLLILKTNDLMRGIEHSLKTESRMSSFMVMSRSCVKSVYDERLKLCRTRFSRLHISVSKQWALFKISLYYTYLSLRSFSFRDSLFVVLTMTS